MRPAGRESRAPRRLLGLGLAWEGGLRTMSTRKSKMSVRLMAAAMSVRCSVRRLFSSEWVQARLDSCGFKGGLRG